MVGKRKGGSEERQSIIDQLSKSRPWNSHTPPHEAPRRFSGHSPKPKSNAVPLMSPGNLSVAQDQLSRFSGDRVNNTATFVAVVVFVYTRPDAESHKWIICTKARSKQPTSQVTSGTERILVKHKHVESVGEGGAGWRRG